MNAVMRLAVSSFLVVSVGICYVLVYVERQTNNYLDTNGGKQIPMNSRSMILQTPTQQRYITE